MGFVDNLVVGAGIVALGFAAQQQYKEFQETQRRKNTPLHFDEHIPEQDFVAIVQQAVANTPRVSECVVSGMTINLEVKSNSGLSAWKAEVDFNDYGYLTGQFWVESENKESLIPEHVASAVRAEIETRVSGWNSRPPSGSPSR